ncbi:MAG TPA: DUF1302 family protein [Telluria sp.]|jgi:hypothetical protein
MLRPFGYCRRSAGARVIAAVAGAIALASGADVLALEARASGALVFGAAWRTQAPDPKLLVAYNAAVIGLHGLANGGHNTDDANLNFRRGDATTRALKGYLDLAFSEGSFSALLRLKAWHDFALSDHPRPWGNNANGYTGGQALGDSGADRLSRFSGVAPGEAVVQHQGTAGAVRIRTRLGQQSLAWGERAGFGGGLASLNALDQPASHRAGAMQQELRVPLPMLFVRTDVHPALALEGFYTRTFRPSALDMCGTFWATVDYLAGGCERAFAGAMAVNDRDRLQGGLYLKRGPSPFANDGAQYGLAAHLNWPAGGTQFGLYHARTIATTPMPGLYKSTRVGPGLVAGDPDGKNIVFFVGHAEDIKLFAVDAAHQNGATTWRAELAYRPNQPLMLPPGDVLPAFLSPSAPSLLRADADAIAPGGVFTGFDRYRTVQLQAGVQHEWGRAGSAIWSGAAHIVGKHVMSLPDPARRRYGRPEQFGTGPVGGVCTVTALDAARQCSLAGYVSASAWAYRLRIDARLAELLPGLKSVVSAQFTHDVKGWSHDFLLSEGRKAMQLALRFEYQQRYLAELVATPVWGGAYNNQIDRDQLALAVGIKF